MIFLMTLDSKEDVKFLSYDKTLSDKPHVITPCQLVTYAECSM